MTEFLQHIVNGLSVGTIYALIALGYTMVYGVLAADGFLSVTKAIADTKSTEAAKIRDYLVSKLKDYPGLTGKLAFNAKGDRVGELYRVYKVDQGGNFVLQPK